MESKDKTIRRLISLKKVLDNIPGVISVGHADIQIEHDTFFRLFRKEDCTVNRYSFDDGTFDLFRAVVDGVEFCAIEYVEED